MEIGHIILNCDKNTKLWILLYPFCLFRGLDRVCGNFVQEAKGAKGAQKRGWDSSQFRLDNITLIYVLISELQNVTDLIHVAKMRIKSGKWRHSLPCPDENSLNREQRKTLPVRESTKWWEHGPGAAQDKRMQGHHGWMDKWINGQMDK